MALQARTAKRNNAKPLIGLYAQSGAGKTYSALLLARGFVGPNGRICMIETESGRGEAYASPTEYPEIGGYDVISLTDNFSPATYGEAITIAEKGGYDAMIVDSASHEWEGTGGVLDMAETRAASGMKGVLVWQKPKIDHQKHFMLRFMQTSIPLVILNMRAKYPMVEVFNPKKNRNEPQRSETLEPKQSDDILYEMFVHGWIDREDHRFHPTKVTVESLKPIFKDGIQISLDTGKQLAAWAASSGGETTNEQSPQNKIKALAAQILSEIKNSNSDHELYDLLYVDLVDDMETIKQASEITYDFILKAYNDRMADLKGGSEDV